MNISHTDIPLLIQQVKQGDLAAQRQLYYYCFVHCFKVAQIYCGHREEAMSVFNHSMLDVFDQLDQLQHPARITSWVGAIIKRDCIDQIRKQGTYRNKLVVLDETETDIVVENDALTELAMADIISLVNQLKSTYRLCFIMRALEGYTYDEISKKLSINLNTAKWYYSEAKKILREKIGGLYHFNKKMK